MLAWLNFWARRRGDDGAAAIEFALVLLPLLFIVAGILEFGRAYNYQIRLTSATREAVRVVALEPTDTTSGGATQVTTDATNRAKAVFDPGGTATGLSISGTTSTCTTTSPATANASITFQFQVSPLSGLGGNWLGSTITLTSTGVMRCGA